MTKPISPLFLQFKNNRILLIALILSLLAHLVLLSKFSINIPSPENKKQTFSVNFTQAKMAKVDISSTKNILSTKKINLTEKIKPIATVSPSVVPLDEINNQQNTNTEETVILNDKVNPQAIESTVSINNQAMEKKATESNIQNTTAVKPTPPTYRYVEVEYDVLNAKTSCHSRESFVIDKNGSYTLSAVCTYRDSANNIIQSFKQRSEGAIGEFGLIPGYYSLQEGADNSNMYSASFAWQEGFVNLNKNNQNTIEPLVEGLQDSLSYKYQFMFNQSIKTPAISIADGKQLKIYTYQSIGEESLSTQLGELRALHLQSSDNNEKNDIWLALDYQYLPIKTLFTDKNGTIIYQQIVRSISTVNR